MDGRVTDVSSADEDADGYKEVVGGPSDILDDHKVHEIVGGREKDFADDHACAVCDKEDNSEKKNTGDVS